MFYKIICILLFSNIINAQSSLVTDCEIPQELYPDLYLIERTSYDDPFLSFDFKSPGDSIKSGTSLVFYCKDPLVPDTLKADDVICINGSWSRSFVKCVGTCKPQFYNPLRADVKYIKDNTTTQLSIGEYPIGTIAQFKCKEGYYLPGSQIITYNSTCSSNGQWTQKIQDCLPLSSAKHIAYIAGGIEVKREEVSYHVAIYRNFDGDWKSICGGAIVDYNLIVSAAHCFWNKNEEAIYDPKLFLVVAGTTYKNFNETDSGQIPQQRNIHKIITHRSYNDFTTNYEDDIAFVILTESFDFNQNVNSVVIFPPLELIRIVLKGSVSGYGLTEKRTTSEYLLKTTLSIDDCSKYASSLAKTKFCAVGNDSFVCRGDSGGGFIIDYDDIQYIVGVVSSSVSKDPTMGCGLGSAAYFTDVSHYFSLFVSARDEINQKLLCENYKFQCDSKKCLEIDTVCNGISDCDDGQDEDPKNCYLKLNQIQLRLGVTTLFHRLIESVPMGVEIILFDFLNQNTNDKLQEILGDSLTISQNLTKDTKIISVLKNVLKIESKAIVQKKRGVSFRSEILEDFTEKVEVNEIDEEEEYYDEDYYADYDQTVQGKTDYKILERDVVISLFVKNQFIHKLPSSFSTKTVFGIEQDIQLMCTEEKLSIYRNNELSAYNIEMPINEKITYLMISPLQFDSSHRFRSTLYALNALKYDSIFTKPKLIFQQSVCFPEIHVNDSLDFIKLLFKFGYSALYEDENPFPNMTNGTTKLNMKMDIQFEISGKEDITSKANQGLAYYARYFIVQKPFIYLLLEKSTKTILYMGVHYYETK